MRIVAGEKRGLILKAPKGLDTRPTADRVKEAIFSSISAIIRDSVVLDAFAGTGALGLEALSRGAEEVDFIEKNKATFSVLKSNLEKAKYEDKAHCYFEDTLNFLRRTQNTYDIIFLDPPYQSGLYEEVLKIIKERNILHQNGIIIVESKKNTLFFDENSIFLNNKQKNYGDTTITYLVHYTQRQEEL